MQGKMYLETINLTMATLTEGETSEMVDKNPIKSPTEYDMDPCFDENAKIAFSKLDLENADAFATENDDFKYPTTVT